MAIKRRIQVRKTTICVVKRDFFYYRYVGFCLSWVSTQYRRYVFSFALSSFVIRSWKANIYFVIINFFLSFFFFIFCIAIPIYFPHKIKKRKKNYGRDDDKTVGRQEMAKMLEKIFLNTFTCKWFIIENYSLSTIE